MFSLTIRETDFSNQFVSSCVVNLLHSNVIISKHKCQNNMLKKYKKEWKLLGK